MSKKKVKKNEGWYGKLCQMMSNHNIVRKWLIGIVMLFLCGIFNSFFSGFYDSCSIVIGNASVGFFRKFVDLYYVASARAELTDGSNEITWFVYCFLIAAMWIYAMYLSGSPLINPKAFFRRQLILVRL